MVEKVSKNILVVSYYFFPENTPRAFRTFELVRELARGGHQVHLVLPNKSRFKDNPVQLQGVNISFLGKLIKSQSSSAPANKVKQNPAKNVLRGVYQYFIPFSSARPYIKQLYTFLTASRAKYDMVISISTPVVCHIGVALSMLKSRQLANTPVKIAEYSDPFSNQHYTRMLFLYRYVDKWIGRMFNYIVVPTEKAVNSYTSFTSNDRIKVIPQGFDFTEVTTLPYEKNNISTFAYAGIFYEKIRNPDFLFEYLLKQDVDFKFFVFTRRTNFTVAILNEYKSLLKDKLEIRYDVPRLQLITTLSQMDFLVNINNDTKDQVPSKLVDYTLAGRPIYSVTKNDFDQQELNRFLAGDYTTSTNVDIRDFDIKQVAQKFLEL